MAAVKAFALDLMGINQGFHCEFRNKTLVVDESINTKELKAPSTKWCSYLQ